MWRLNQALILHVDLCTMETETWGLILQESFGQKQV